LPLRANKTGRGSQTCSKRRGGVQAVQIYKENSKLGEGKREGAPTYIVSLGTRELGGSLRFHNQTRIAKRTSQDVPKGSLPNREKRNGKEVDTFRTEKQKSGNMTLGPLATQR